MQQSIVHKRPRRGARDGWVWIGAQVSVRGAYKRLCEGNHEENPSILRACRFIWRQTVPLKLRFFGWLLLRRRRKTRVLRKRSYPDTSTDCNLCLGDDEDCAHLSFARTLLSQQPISMIDTTSETSLWESIQWKGRWEEEGVRILAVFWAIWLHPWWQKYIPDLLAETGFTDCQPTKTPIEVNHRLNLNKNDSIPT